MNKLLTKIAKLFLGISMAAGVGVAIGSNNKTEGASAAYTGDSPWSHTFVTGDVTAAAQASKPLSNVTWSISAATYKGWDDTKGIQIGSGGNPQLSDWTMTAAISQFGTNIGITSISVGISTANSGGIAWSLTAGGSTGTGSTGSSSTAISSVTTKTATYSTPVSSGDVVIALNSNEKSKAIYIHDISIEFEEVAGSGEVNINTSTFTKPGSGSGYAAYDGNRRIGATNITSKDVMINSSKLQFKTSTGWLKNTTSLTRITKITLASTSGLAIYLGTTEFSSRPSSGDTATSGSAITGTYGFFAVTSTGSTPTTASISVEYTTETGYTVTWKNWDNSVLKTDTNVAEGTTPSYDGSDPTRAATAQYTYTFTGWSPTPAAISGDVTYTAQYSSTLNKYTVTWQNYDGSIIEKDENVNYGTVPTFDSAENPTRDADAHYTYSFTGWSPAVGAITGNTTYTAQYSTTINKYTVYWKNYDETLLETDTEVPYGTTPEYNGLTPTKAGTAQYHYTHIGWTPSVGPITGETIYVAQFSEDVNKFSVTGVISRGGLDNYDDIQYDGDLLVTIVPESNAYGFPESVKVEMGGVDVTSNVTYDSSDGTIMMEHVTGSIVITAICPSLATYSIDYSGITNGSASGDTIVRQAIGSTASITISTNGHSHLPQSVTVKSNGVDLTAVTDYTYNSSTGSLVLTITANYSGNIVITATCVAYEQYDVSLSLDGATRTSGPYGANAIEEGETNSTWVFKPVTDYVLPNTISVVSNGNTLISGTDYTWTKATGTLVIPTVTGDLEITVQADAKALVSITLSKTSGSYTLGDTLENVEVTAHFNTGATETVTSSTEISGSCIDSDTKMLIQQGTDSPITFSYTFENVTKTETYYATVGKVTPKDPYIGKVTDASTLQLNDRIVLVNESASVAMTTSAPATGTLGVSSVTISNNKITSELDSSVAILTLSGGNSSSGWELTNDDKYLYVPNNNNRGTVLRTTEATNVISISSGDATIKASSSATGTLQFNNSANPKRFSNYTSSQQTVQIYKIFDAVEKSLIRITAELKTGTYYQLSTVTSDDFTVTAYYDDATSETVTNDITVTNGYLANLGNNTVTVTYGGKSFNVIVNAVVQTAVFTGLSWAQGEYTIIDGQSIDFSNFGTITAEYDNGESPSLNKDVEHCSVAIYTKNGNSYSKVSDILDGATITSSSHGKYLGVTYTETNTFTAYSSAPIYVVESINDVYGKEETTVWSKATSINAGDVVTFVNETESKVASSASSNIINATVFEDSISSALSFTVGKVGNYYTFQNEGGYLGNHSTGTSGNNYAYLDDEIDTSDDKKNYFTVEFNEGNVVITSVYSTARSLQLRKDGTKDRFCFYGSTQEPIQLYKAEQKWLPTGDSIANTNAVAQKVVLEFAEHFNDVMECVQAGSTSDVSGKWSGLADDFDNWFNNGDKDLTESQVEHAKALFAGADAVQEGDSLQDMLARYEYICAKYKLDDFLSDAGRLPVAQSPTVNPLINIIGGNQNTIATIVIISMVSVTAIGGYFFLRKRRED